MHERFIRELDIIMASLFRWLVIDTSSLIMKGSLKNLREWPAAVGLMLWRCTYRRVGSWPIRTQLAWHYISQSIMYNGMWNYDRVKTQIIWVLSCMFKLMKKHNGTAPGPSGLGSNMISSKWSAVRWGSTCACDSHRQILNDELPRDSQCSPALHQFLSLSHQREKRSKTNSDRWIVLSNSCEVCNQQSGVSLT